MLNVVYIYCFAVAKSLFIVVLQCDMACIEESIHFMGLSVVFISSSHLRFLLSKSLFMYFRVSAVPLSFKFLMQYWEEKYCTWILKGEEGQKQQTH
jgi:hypothetical protein